MDCGTCAAAIAGSEYIHIAVRGSMGGSVAERLSLDDLGNASATDATTKLYVIKDGLGDVVSLVAGHGFPLWRALILFHGFHGKRYLRAIASRSASK
jgi:hypothetical protein